MATTITKYNGNPSTLPNPTQGQPFPVIVAFVLPDADAGNPGTGGMVPALCQGPGYDVLPVKLSNGSYAMLGANF
jgi:hypothetical protein